MGRVNATVLVDWNSQLHNWNLKSISLDKQFVANRALEMTTRLVSRALSLHDPSSMFVVTLRLYHGWTKGYQDQNPRTALRTVVAGFDFSTSSRSKNVVFNPNVGFGDLLLWANDSRIHPVKKIHLPGTLRERPFKQRKLEEKMVDTAMAADLLAMAITDPGDLSIVLAEDDDLVPPVFTAERIKAAHGGSVYIMQKRTPKNRFVCLDGLIMQGAWNDRC